MKNKPVIYPQSDKSTYEDKLSVEGYEVQKLVEEFLQSTEHKSSFSFEKTFSTDDGLYAVADIVRKNVDGTFDLYEVKSTANIEANHLIDAAFQTIAIENSGKIVNAIYIVHLNKDYVGDQLEICKMLKFSLVTEKFGH